MAAYESICNITKKKEAIWVEQIPVPTFDNPNGVILGLMLDCTVRQREGIELCDKCNIRKELP